MVAAIFAAHGVYWGDRQQQSAGYDTFENQRIKGILKAHYGLPFCEMPESTTAALSEIWSAVPQNKPWMMKTGIEYFKVFRPLSPFNVFITRKPEDVVKSICAKRQGVNPDVALEAAQWRFKQMQIMHQQAGGVWVDTDRLIAGDHTQIREALEFCGVIYDKENTDGAIKR